MSDDDQELDEFFEVDDSEEVEESETTAEEAETEVETEVETEEEAESETASEEETDSKSIPMPAYMEEKRKRQELEKRLAELEPLIPKQEEEAPDPYDDIDAYNEFMRKKWEREQEESQRQETVRRIEEKRQKLLEQHDDFLEMEEIFQMMVIKTPSLRDEMIQSGNEVEFAYEKAKEYHDSFFKAAVDDSMAEESEESTPKPKRKPNLANINGGGNSVEVEKEDELEDVFADMKY